MVGSRDLGDDVIPHPALRRVGRKLRCRHVEPDGACDLRHAGKRYEVLIRARFPAGPEPPVERSPRAAEAATDAVRERARSGDDRDDHGGSAVLRNLELEVVDVAHQPLVVIDELPVEEVQAGVERAWGSHQLPPLVASISGMAATAATRIRMKYAVPSRFVSREFTSSPM